MSYEVLKMKDFNWKWVCLRFVYRVDKKLSFPELDGLKEIGIWFNPSKTVNFDVKRSPGELNNHLDRCYDFGLRINRTKMWVSITLKTGK
jgi:hypothetical protein